MAMSKIFRYACYFIVVMVLVGCEAEGMVKDDYYPKPLPAKPTVPLKKRPIVPTSKLPRPRVAEEYATAEACEATEWEYYEATEWEYYEEE